MPHKYVYEELLENIRKQISSLDVQIASIRSIARKDKDGIELLLVRLKQLLDSSRKKKDTAMDGLMEDGNARILSDGTKVQAQLFESRIQERMSLIFWGEEKAFAAVIEMLENPDAAVDIFIQEREDLKKQLSYYEKMEKRSAEEPPAENR